jgi:uncharacterized membrane protein (UPF0127 family)
MKQSVILIKDFVKPCLVARTHEEQVTGLMGIDCPTPIMCFKYNRPQCNIFWMKNTKCALDIVFCREGKVIAIKKGEPQSLSVIDCGMDSDLVVEFPYGTCGELGISEGSKVKLITK